MAPKPNNNNNANAASEIPDYLLKLIEGYSTYNKVYIKYWLTVALFSLIIIVSTKNKSSEKITLLIDILKLDKESFYPLAFVMLSILILCFASAFSQSFRSAKLMYRAIEKIKDQYIFPGDVHLKDIVDCMFYPSLTRVAPIAQLARGKGQFYPENKNISAFRKTWTTIYYVLLKIVVVLVMYLLPTAALYVSFINGIWKQESGIVSIPSVVFWIPGVTAFVVLTQLFIEDCKFLYGVMKHLLRP